MEKNSFTEWILENLERRGWTNSELARRAEVVPSTVSLVISGKSQPGVDFCRGVARAFNEPPEKVFRLAGLLPPFKDELEEDVTQFLFYWRQLNPDQQREIAAMVRALDELNRLREKEIRNANPNNDGLEPATA